MRSAVAKSVVMGLLTGFVGVILTLTPFGRRVEEDVGLGLLFTLRGPREVPPGITIIGIDKPSVKSLGLPENMESWPRGIYARLVQGLVDAGAALVVLDIFFADLRNSEDDRLFASAVEKAGNVVVVGELEKERNVLGSGQSGEALSEKVVPPYKPLAESAAAYAPFVLPKVPVKVSQTWLFRTEAAVRPTLPTVAFMVRNDALYEELLSVLFQNGLSISEEVPRTAVGLRGGDKAARALSEIRDAIISDSRVRERISAITGGAQKPSSERQGNEKIHALLALLTSPDSRYLNFYGPPGTLPTRPLAAAIGGQSAGRESVNAIDVRGHAVFVGLSDLHTPGQKDGFHTVFSQETGFDLSGVEILATAYANIVDSSWVSPLSATQEVLLLMALGIFIGTACRLAPLLLSLATAVTVGCGYLYFSYSCFVASASWYPITPPLLVQIPLAVVGSALWRLSEAGKERERLRASLGEYLPREMVGDLLAGRLGAPKETNTFYSVCLYSDAGHYTRLAESMEPQALADLMNRYFEVVFGPIRRHEGTISNVVADSVLALWISMRPDPTMHRRACLAALEIEAAVDRFNRDHCDTPLPTRIGLHAGEIYLGSIGALDHYEYRPFGDMVNTATRLDGISRALGVRISMSEDVRRSAGDVITREIGLFKVQGKEKPLLVHELIGRPEGLTVTINDAYELFGKGLALFRQRDWGGAENLFKEVLSVLGDDGPSRFYLELCARFRTLPPAGDWQGEVVMMEK